MGQVSVVEWVSFQLPLPRSDPASDPYATRHEPNIGRMTNDNNPNDLRRRLTPLRRAAEILSIPAAELERAVASLPHTRLGTVVLFDIDELRRALLERARLKADGSNEDRGAR
ncbi:MAG: hypothetical protein IPH13_12200 [Planctomycetes bacterium]|nr:hypothetical protein [Planctomycetota bacterium]